MQSSKEQQGEKQALLSEQCKEKEENKRRKRLEISSRKSDTKGTFHAKTGTIKNSMDRTEADDIKKRWRELYKKVLMTQITTMV